jgi:hypothetical protein
MAAIANRELSQFAAFLDVDGAGTGTPSNIGIATNTTVNVGIGTSIASSKLTIQGNVQVSGALTATSTLNSPIIVAPTAYINTGIVTNITGTNLNCTGIATVANLSVTSSATLGSLGVSTASFNTIYSVVGVVTNIAGTGLTYTSGTFTNLVSNNGYAPQNVVLNYSIKRNGAEVNSGSSAAVNVTPFTSSTINIVSNYVPNQSGNYTIDVTAAISATDEDPSDNAIPAPLLCLASYVAVSHSVTNSYGSLTNVPSSVALAI